MATTPPSSAARGGFPGDPDAVNASGQVNQFLGAHGITPVYEGIQTWNPSMLTSPYDTPFYWVDPTVLPVGDLRLYDLDQPFTLSGTTVGRVGIAVQAVGAGADLQVSLCADNSGSPGSVIASTVVPKEWATALGAPDGLTAGGPLATPAGNALFVGPRAVVPWPTAASSAGGTASTASGTQAGDFIVLVGGEDSATASLVSSVYSVPISAAGAQSATLQPSLPQALRGVALCATADTVVSAGGFTGSSNVTSVYTASWDSAAGTIGSWSNQAALPVALRFAGVTTWNDSVVYVVGGATDTAVTDATYYATVQNGQIQSWTPGPPLPVAGYVIQVCVIGNLLLAVGGLDYSNSPHPDVFWAAIGPDGTPGAWQAGPPLPDAVGPGGLVVVDSGVVLLGGATSLTTFTPYIQSLTVTSDGLGEWQATATNPPLNMIGGAIPNGAGAYVIVGLGVVPGISFADVWPLMSVPMLSIPLPAAGLTSGATYHLVFHQIGGDLNNTLVLGELSTMGTWSYTPRGSGGPWTGHTGHALVINVYDQTPTGRVLHTWCDPNTSHQAAKVSTYVRDGVGRLLGECTATAFVTQPGEPPAYLPSAAALVYGDDSGMPTAITQLA